MLAIFPGGRFELRWLVRPRCWLFSLPLWKGETLATFFGGSISLKGGFSLKMFGAPPPRRGETLVLCLYSALPAIVPVVPHRLAQSSARVQRGSTPCHAGVQRVGDLSEGGGTKQHSVLEVHFPRSSVRQVLVVLG